MASKRRGGFRPPELRGTLGTLLRTTTGVVRDALERGAREGRARLDGVRANRRRHDALADLGDLVLDLVRRGEIDLAELPEAADLIRELDDLDGPADPRDDHDDLPRASARSRFDDRARTRPPTDDGTVASGASPPERSTRPTLVERPRARDVSSTRSPTRPIKGPSRPTADDAPRPSRDTERNGDARRRDTVDLRRRSSAAETVDPEPGAEVRRQMPTRDPERKGGISFDDDDLEDYMHPDDVPPKAPPREPGDGEA